MHHGILSWNQLIIYHIRNKIERTCTYMYKHAAYLSEMLFTVTRYIHNITILNQTVFFTFKKLLSTILWFWSLIAHDLRIFDSVTFEFQGFQNWRNLANKRVIQGPSWLKGWKIDDSTTYVYTDIFLFLVVFHHTTYCQKMPKVQKKHKRYTGHICFDLKHSEL